MHYYYTLPSGNITTFFLAHFSNTTDVLLLRRDNLVTFMQRMRNISFTGVLDSTMPHPSVIAILLSTTVLSNASLLNAPDSYEITYATSQQALYAPMSYYSVPCGIQLEATTADLSVCGCYSRLANLGSHFSQARSRGRRIILRFYN